MKLKACCIFMFISLFVLPSFVYASDEQNMEIVVEKSDNLINICRKYLEAPDQWRKIAKINRLSNPHLILPGQKLIIPVALAKGVPLDAKVTFIKGDVQVRPKDSEIWKTLRLNDLVAQGDSIKTGDAGVAEFTFEDSTVLLLRSNTSLDVKTSAQKGFLYAIRDFFLHAGRTISRLKAATGTESRFKIHTPSAVAAARGTEFRVSVDEQETTRTEVLKGRIEVAAMARKVEVSDGEGTLVIKNGSPGTPKKLLMPPSLLKLEALYRVMPLVFTFEQVPGAFNYRIMLSRDRDIRDTIADDVVRPDQELKLAGVDDGLYFMQTRSIDRDGLEGVPSEPVSIRVRTNPLPPFIETPVNGAEFRGKTVKMKWLKVRDAAGYHLQIAEDKEFRKIAEEQNGVHETEYSIQSLSFKTYFFRVNSVAEDGYEGVWSDSLSFTLVPPPPVPPLEQPQISEKDIHFRWRYLGEGISYHFQMAGDSEFRAILIDRKVDAPEITLQKPEAAGNYYVRASGIDATGYEGSFSPPQSFEIKKKTYYGILGVFGTLAMLWLLF